MHMSSLWSLLLGVRSLSCVVVVFALAQLMGCVKPQVYEDPMAIMTHSADPDKRMAAARQAEVTHKDDPARIAALHDMLWVRGRGAEERIYAIDQLIAHDEAAFKKTLDRRLVLVVNDPTLRYLMDTAVKRKWTDLTPAIVRSYARTFPTNVPGERPEHTALLALSPGQSIETIVFEVFANADDQVNINEQTAAWQLLWKLTDGDHIMKMLAMAPDTNPLVVDLKAASRDLHALPVGKEGVLRLSYLRDPSRAGLWQAISQRVAMLTAEQREGLELRHLPVLMLLDDATLARSRESLLAEVRREVDAQEHHTRGPNFDGPMREHPQLLGVAAGELCWADVATLRMLMQAVWQRDVREALFKQADEDLVDTSTEHGGVIFHEGQRFVARIYPPLYTRHDLKYLPTQEMIEATYTGVAHYHFHAQEHRNRDFAGPGVGDVRLAANLEIHGLVFTFIDRDTLNVDYYQPDSTVVDLGVIRR